MSATIYTERVLKTEVATWAPGDWILEEDRDLGHGTHGKRELLRVQDGSDWMNNKKDRN